MLGPGVRPIAQHDDGQRDDGVLDETEEDAEAEQVADVDEHGEQGDDRAAHDHGGEGHARARMHAREHRAEQTVGGDGVGDAREGEQRAERRRRDAEQGTRRRHPARPHEPAPRQRRRQRGGDVERRDRRDQRQRRRRGDVEGCDGDQRDGWRERDTLRRVAGLLHRHADRLEASERPEADAGAAQRSQPAVRQEAAGGQQSGDSSRHIRLGRGAYGNMRWQSRTLESSLREDSGGRCINGRIGTTYRIVTKLRHFHCLLKINNQLNLRNLGTILRGTDPTINATTARELYVGQYINYVQLLTSANVKPTRI